MSSIRQEIPGNTVFDQEQRMKTLMSFIPLKEWDKVRDELNQRLHETDMAQLVNDIPEQWRSHILRHLDENAVSIDERWKSLQRERHLNDPNKVFPLVATSWLLEDLPKSMRSCNMCRLPFTRGENMITKACRKHSLHRQCLAAKLNLNENPFHGECDCNSQESGGEDAYPLVDSQIPQSLPESMATCNICEGSFDNGQEIFTKACGSHSLHRYCLTEKLNENEDPMYGPCDCNTGGYGAPIWRLILDQGKPVTPLPASRIPRLMPRAPTPMPPTYELDEDSQYASSPDLEFLPHSDSSESGSCSSSGSHSDATSTGDWYGWSECSSPPSPTFTEATDLSSP